MAANPQNQDVKLTATLPVLGSERYPTYQQWRRAFDIYCDCFEILRAGREVPLATTYANYSAIRQTSNARCRLLLQDALGPEDWDLVAADPRFVHNLRQLETIHAGAAAADVEHLQFQLSNLTLLPGETLKTYWSRGVSIKRRLADLAVPVTDANLIMWLLEGLPSEWRTFKMHAKLNAGANAGVNQMLSFLQVEEAVMLREKEKARATRPTSALPRFIQARTCFNCGSPDHRVLQCPSFRPAAARTAGVFMSTECSHCHKPGHTADRCFLLHPHLKPQQPIQRQYPGAPQCSHCGLVGHTKEQCYHLIGFPKRDFTGGRERSRSPSAHRSEPGPALFLVFLHLLLVRLVRPHRSLSRADSLPRMGSWILAAMSTVAQRLYIYRAINPGPVLARCTPYQ